MLPRVLPMKAVTGELPVTDGWSYEIKWDGMRVMAYLDDSPLRLETTRGKDAAARFPELAGLPEAVRPLTAILDGEIVAFDGDRPSFGRLQHRMHVVDHKVAARRAADTPAVLMVFDIVHLDGHDLTALPYLRRRQLLAQVVDDSDAWRVPPHHLDQGAELLEAARASGLEGVMAKRQESVYLPGKRSPTWLKVKVRRRQELVVGGWLPGTGNRSGRLGSLLVGYHTPDGALRYAGRVGTGFNDAELKRLGMLLSERSRDTSPFDQPAPTTVARQARWVDPTLVVEVAFGEWTSDGILRHPSYLHLRDDKDPSEVVRES